MLFSFQTRLNEPNWSGFQDGSAQWPLAGSPYGSGAKSVNGVVSESGVGSPSRVVVIHRDERGFGFVVAGDNPVFVQTVREGKAKIYKILKNSPTLLHSAPLKWAPRLLLCASPAHWLFGTRLAARAVLCFFSKAQVARSFTFVFVSARFAVFPRSFFVYRAKDAFFQLNSLIFRLFYCFPS